MVQQTVSATNLPAESIVKEEGPKVSSEVVVSDGKKKIYQSWWFWVIVVVVVLGLAAFIYLR